VGEAVGLVVGVVVLVGVASPPQPGMSVTKNTRLTSTGKAYLIDFFHIYINLLFSGIHLILFIHFFFLYITSLNTASFSK
jgi:hypothetical protein